MARSKVPEIKRNDDDGRQEVQNYWTTAAQEAMTKCSTVEGDRGRWVLFPLYCVPGWGTWSFIVLTRPGTATLQGALNYDDECSAEEEDSLHLAGTVGDQVVVK